jgi:hypothetical protein
MMCVLVYGAFFICLFECRPTFLIDNDLQVFSSRQPRKNNNGNDKKSGEIHDSYGYRERRDSHRDRDQKFDQQQGTSRVYTPAQFENSLGKLQVWCIYRFSFKSVIPLGEDNRNIVVTCLSNE